MTYQKIMQLYCYEASHLKQNFNPLWVNYYQAAYFLAKQSRFKSELTQTPLYEFICKQLPKQLTDAILQQPDDDNNLNSMKYMK